MTSFQSEFSDTDRLNYVLTLLNSGGTNALVRIAPEVCCDWERSLIDSALADYRKGKAEVMQTAIRKLQADRDEIDRKISEIQNRKY